MAAHPAQRRRLYPLHVAQLTPQIPRRQPFNAALLTLVFAHHRQQQWRAANRGIVSGASGVAVAEAAPAVNVSVHG